MIDDSYLTKLQAAGLVWLPANTQLTDVLEMVDTLGIRHDEVTLVGGGTMIGVRAAPA